MIHGLSDVRVMDTLDTNLVIVIIILVLTAPQRHTETDTYYITFHF